MIEDKLTPGQRIRLEAVALAVGRVHGLSYPDDAAEVLQVAALFEAFIKHGGKLPY